MEGMWTWFLPAVQQALAWYRDGRIGELLHVKSDFGYPLTYSEDLREYDARVGGGAVLEMGVYPVAIARLFIGRGPDSIDVVGRRAPNGVEDDVSAIFDYGDCMATLGTSFRCKLQNWTYIIGTEGYIAIPDFWRAERCALYELDTLVDSFEDGRITIGFDHEIDAVSRDILEGRRESPVIPLATSLALQEDMKAIRDAIPRD
jgi:predicted dehydrogenase